MKSSVFSPDMLKLPPTANIASKKVLAALSEPLPTTPKQFLSKEKRARMKDDEEVISVIIYG